MIRNFADRDTERLYQREPVRRLPAELRRLTLRRLVALEAVDTIEELCSTPSIRVERVPGKRAGVLGIRIQDRWRIRFRWRDGHAHDVEIEAGKAREAEAMAKAAVKAAAAAAAAARGKKVPIHPGEVLLADFLKPLGLTQYRLARDICVPPRRINEIVLLKRSVTADTALRLARYLGTSELFWLNLQARFDLEAERDRLGARLESEVAVRAA